MLLEEIRILKILKSLQRISILRKLPLLLYKQMEEPRLRGDDEGMR